MSQLYREIILDYYANPRNKGTLANPSISASDWNPLCGDKIKFEIAFGKDGRVTESRWSGEGCAISQASASMLTEKVEGLNKNELAGLKEPDILEMLNVQISPGRKKCALLGWLVMRKALKL